MTAEDVSTRRIPSEYIICIKYLAKILLDFIFEYLNMSITISFDSCFLVVPDKIVLFNSRVIL